MSEKTHNGESWPYHKDAKGNMVACASNPCRLHGGKDVMATSTEQAYEIVNENSMVGLQTSQQEPERDRSKDIEDAAETILDAQAYVMEQRHLNGMPYNDKYQMQEIRQDIRE